MKVKVNHRSKFSTYRSKTVSFLLVKHSDISQNLFLTPDHDQFERFVLWTSLIEIVLLIT